MLVNAKPMWIFSLILSLLEYAWRFFSWVGEMLWKLAAGSFHIGCKLVGGVADLLLRPFSWGIDRLWDLGVQGAGGLWNVFGWVLAALLTACLAFALVAAAGNLYRRIKRGR